MPHPTRISIEIRGWCSTLPKRLPIYPGIHASCEFVCVYDLSHDVRLHAEIHYTRKEYDSATLVGRGLKLFLVKLKVQKCA